ncbi:hypothetical protein ABH922_001865 [Rhodococcus sp. 27YEA15]|uniref:hypothetical protein n=1 Tax=Rhodococcus sp. 27YEA15 TaxID=3156259 RepID=UPI003C7B3C14
MHLTQYTDLGLHEVMRPIVVGADFSPGTRDTAPQLDVPYPHAVKVVTRVGEAVTSDPPSEPVFDTELYRPAGQREQTPGNVER